MTLEKLLFKRGLLVLVITSMIYIQIIATEICKYVL